MAQVASNTDTAVQNHDPNNSTLVTSKKVWTALITNLDYLPGLLTLEFSIRRVGSAYPLLVLYTDAFPQSGLAALALRHIPARRIPYLLPTVHKDFSRDPRFYDCWSKLTPFGLTEFDRVVQLDSDMIVLKNMDELMDVVLDPPRSKDPLAVTLGEAATKSSTATRGNRVFAACHACCCNPMHRQHYPASWVPENCAYTTQHSGSATVAAAVAPPPTAGLGIPNGGLQVVNPCAQTYAEILHQLTSGTNTASIQSYDFADQSLLGDVFAGRWVSLPYVYNALRTMRRRGVHDAIWSDDDVRCLHFILDPKPWHQRPSVESDDLSSSWWHLTDLRRRVESESGIHDGF